MPPRNPGPGVRDTGPLLTPLARGLLLAATLLALFALWGWAAIDPTFWSCC